MPKFLFPLIAHHLHGEVRILDTIADFELFSRHHKVSEKHIFHSCYIDPEGAFIRTAYANEWVVRDELGRIVRQGEFDLPGSDNWRKRLRNRRGNFEFRFDPVPNRGRCKRHRHSAPRKKNGGAGVRARITAHHSHDPRRDIE